MLPTRKPSSGREYLSYPNRLRISRTFHFLRLPQEDGMDPVILSAQVPAESSVLLRRRFSVSYLVFVSWKWRLLMNHAANNSLASSMGTDRDASARMAGGTRTMEVTISVSGMREGAASSYSSADSLCSFRFIYNDTFNTKDEVSSSGSELTILAHFFDRSPLDALSHC